MSLKGCTCHIPEVHGHLESNCPYYGLSVESALKKDRELTQMDEDLTAYLKKLPSFASYAKIEDDLVRNTVKEIQNRSTLYIEFLAAAFMKETGLKASEVVLVCKNGIDEIRWWFEPKNK